MPYYEYHCPANGRTLEVRHGMSERVDTWGGLVERAGIAAGDTPITAPVERILSAPVPLTGGPSGPAFGGCGSGCGCARGA